MKRSLNVNTVLDIRSTLFPAFTGKSELLHRKPVAYLVCNQTPPLKDKPSLMTFREVETLFHEVTISKFTKTREVIVILKSWIMK